MSTIILTENSNVARHLQRCEKDPSYRADRQAKTWVTRTIQTVEDWVDQLIPTVLRHDYSGWTVLSSAQEHILWQQIISAWQNAQRDYLSVIYDEQERRQIALLNLDDTASSAAKCWKRLRQYLALETPYLHTLKSLRIGRRLWDKTSLQAGQSQRSFWDSQSQKNVIHSDADIAAYCLEQLSEQKPASLYDARRSAEFQPFLEWQHSFQQLCQKNRWIDQAVLPSLLTSFLLSHSSSAPALALPETIIAYGFINAPASSCDIRALSECEASIAPQTLALLKALAQNQRQVRFAQELSDIFERVPEQLQCQFSCQVSSSPKANSRELKPDDDQPISVYDSDTQEFYAVAHQVRRLVSEAGAKNVGVILPQLEEVRDKITACFDEVLCSRTVLPQYSRFLRPYTISLGKSLGEMPMVRSALTFLTLLSEAVEIRALTNLINSPYLCGHPQALNDCAYLDSKMRGTQKKYLSWPEFCNLSAENQKRDSVSMSYNSFCKNLRTVQELLDQDAAEPPQHKTYDYWGRFFLQVLSTMRWPMKRQLLPAEHKLKNSFRTLLLDFQKLTLTDSRPLTYSEALRNLENLAASAIFQPPPTPKAPIHISGILEAVGLRFEHIFILSYTDRVWPSLSSPLPYLPIQLQTALRMPGTESEAIKLAQWVNQRLSSTAPRGTVSFANRMIDNKNQRELHLSPLISGLNCQFDIQAAPGANAEAEQPWYRQLISQCFSQDNPDATPAASSEGGKGGEDSAWPSPSVNKYLEEYPNAAPPPPDPQKIKGGSSLLQNQIDCPFKALVQARWLKEELDEYLDSPDAKSKGDCIHRALERLWQTWDYRYSNFQQRLEEYRSLSAADYANQTEYSHALQQTKLCQDISAAVGTVLQEQEEKRSEFGPTFYRVEKLRLTKLLLDWFIRIEEQRHKDAEDYRVSCEESVILRLGKRASETDTCASTELPKAVPVQDATKPDALQLNLRLDRVDEFTDAEGQKSYYLSDYKTSDKYRLCQWYDPNNPQAAPSKVQLPLYALYISRAYGEEALRGLGYDRLLSKRTQTDVNGQSQTFYGHSFLALTRSSDGKADTETCNPTLSSNNSDKKAYKNKPLFHDLLAAWEDALEDAARNFLDGKHPVSPRSVADSCQYCHLRPLCRRPD
ncbi:MAG: PD-(D/E)XK nuclease family protein [bacterium]|nr:PD-(D/E)XK nuclease family protein [bacterium]